MLAPAFRGGLMTTRSKRLAIAVVLTIVDIAAFNDYCGVIWEAFARDLFAKAALLGLLCFWVASSVVIWLHVAYDFRQTLGERDTGLAFSTATTPTKFERDSNV
jgi:hypothetical protein